MRKTLGELSSKTRAPRLQRRRSTGVPRSEGGVAPATSDRESGHPTRKKLAPGGKISNLQAIERLGALQATIDEASCFFGVTQPTFSKRLREHPEMRAAWSRGQAIGQMSLRRLVWDRALQPNASGVRAALFLAKQLIWSGQDQLLEKADSAGGGTREPEETLGALSDDERCTLNEILKSSMAHRVYLRGDWRAIAKERG